MSLRFFRFLNAPYPVEVSYRRVVVGACCVSVFVSLFLVLFQPFHLSTLHCSHRLLIIASFGLPCFPVMIVQGLSFIWISAQYDFEAYWRVKHQILATLLIPLLIGISNYFHGQLVFDWAFSWKGLGQMLFYTEAVAFFPVVGIVAWDWSKLMRKHRGLAANVTESPNDSEQPISVTAAEKASPLCLVGENQQEQLMVYPEQLLFVKAEGNYVELASLSDDGELEQTLLRAPLKSVESQLSSWSGSILRCHRSYLVNRAKILKAEGNAQGLILTLQQSIHRVPVSRKYVDLFRSRSNGR